MQARLEWIDINQVLPNPKNPRRDHSINTKEMQEIIMSRGWEEGITCYQHASYYVILSGHRRWYAAKEIGLKEIPLFIVEAPQSHAEELDRLGSVQGGQEEWSPYELAKYTYDMWRYLGDIAFAKLAKKLGVSKGLVEARIRVYKYYPRIEIEDKLENGMYSITMLDYIHTWIKRLLKYQPTITQLIDENFIKQQMLKKYENKCFNSQLVNDRSFVVQASIQEVMNFMTDIKKKLVDCQMEMLSRNHDKQKDIVMNRMEITATINGIKSIEYRTKKEAQKLLEELEKMDLETRKRIDHINAFTKNDEGSGKSE